MPTSLVQIRFAQTGRLAHNATVGSDAYGCNTAHRSIRRCSLSLAAFTGANKHHVGLEFTAVLAQEHVRIALSLRHALAKRQLHAASLQRCRAIVGCFGRRGGRRQQLGPRVHQLHCFGRKVLGNFAGCPRQQVLAPRSRRALSAHEPSSTPTMPPPTIKTLRADFSR